MEYWATTPHMTHRLYTMGPRGVNRKAGLSVLGVQCQDAGSPDSFNAKAPKGGKRFSYHPALAGFVSLASGFTPTWTVATGPTAGCNTHIREGGLVQHLELESVKSGKVRVAYLVRPTEGGIKSQVLTLMSGLDRSRFETVLICPPDCSLYTEAQQAGYRVIPIDLVGEVSPVYDLATAWELRGILRKIRPHILHIHSTKAGLVGRMAVSWMVRRPKVILTVHSFVFDERVGRRRRKMTVRVERRLARYTDRIVAVSKALRDELVTEMRLPPEKLQVIYNGIVFQDLPKPPHEGIIGTVARLAPQKGVEHFIRAAAIVKAKHPSARFVIIGDGPYRYFLELEAQSAGIRDSTEFTGFRSDALSIVAGFDVFVLPSIRETFGLALVEAMSQGVPAVASNVGGIPEIVEDMQTGLLAEPGNPEDIAEKVCRLLENKELAERLARQGCEFVRAQFTAERMIHEIEELYASVVAG